MLEHALLRSLILAASGVVAVSCACTLVWTLGLLGPACLLVLWPLAVAGLLAAGTFVAVFAGRV